jgi:hypothetical protein
LQEDRRRRHLRNQRQDRRRRGRVGSERDPDDSVPVGLSGSTLEVVIPTHTGMYLDDDGFQECAARADPGN